MLKRNGFTIQLEITQSLLLQTALPGVQHHENAFSDFTVQGLLPNYLSRQGPCIEVADINKDGLEDFFMGGAKDQPSQIFIQNTNGHLLLSLTGNIERCYK